MNDHIAGGIFTGDNVTDTNQLGALQLAAAVPL